MVNYYEVEVKGRKVKRFLDKVFKLNIDVFDIKYYKDRIVFKVRYDDYIAIKKVNTIYDIRIISTKGVKRINYLIKKYQIFLSFLLLSIFLVIVLSRFIFFIDIETNNKTMKSLIKDELNRHNITLLSYKKSYNDLSKIASDIKNKHKDKIEWIYISNDGVFLRVKFIERIDNNGFNNSDLKDIVASRNGYIRDIYATSGDVVKFRGDYVKAGDVIISGNILRNDNLVARVRASGVVYAEVWYNVKLSTPLKVSKEVKSERGFTSLYIKIFGRKFTVFKFNKKIKSEKDRVLFESPVGSLHLKSEFTSSFKEEKVDDDVLVKMLEDEAKSTIESKLKDKEHILLQKTLKKEVKDGKMYVEVFFKVYLDIAKEQDIKEYIEEEKEE